MRTATTVEASGLGSWSRQADFVVEAERLGLDVCWVAEAWGSDAPSALGFYAARTERMLLGSAVMQVGTRTPVALAQTAITLSNLSGGRFLLGLGPSGPQVMEGLHGVPFARPLARMRETVEIVRQVLAGGKISYSGSEFRIPLPGGEAVPMRLSLRAEHAVPVYLAALSPAMLRLTGQVADGWPYAPPAPARELRRRLRRRRPAARGDPWARRSPRRRPRPRLDLFHRLLGGADPRSGRRPPGHRLRPARPRTQPREPGVQHRHPRRRPGGRLEATLAPGEQAVVAGHSMGGMTVMAASGRTAFREHTAAVLLCSTGSSELVAASTVVPMRPGRLRTWS
ncbi:F420-dependent glucose-6-phosphate dehydrogenase [Streptomyces violarus]